MNESSFNKTVRLAAIFREIYFSKSPDWKVICLAILQELGLSQFGQALQTRRQDWEFLGPTLLDAMDKDQVYQRCIKVLDAVKKNPSQTYDELADLTGFHRTTVQQTLNALELGGIDFNKSFAETENGRPKVLKQLPQ